MKIIKPRVIEVTFHYPEGYPSVERFIERVARTCYQSEDKIGPDSDRRLLTKLIKLGHHSMFECITITARIEADRGFTHELVRQRLASFAQESTRFCNPKEMIVIEQPGIVPYPSDPRWTVWRNAMYSAGNYYQKLIALGVPPEIARSVLPIGLKAEIVITANLREWWHIFELRCSEKAHPIMREIVREIKDIFKTRIPYIYDGLPHDQEVIDEKENI